MFGFLLIGDFLAKYAFSKSAGLGLNHFFSRNLCLSSFTFPGASMMLAELAMEAGLPNGVLNIVHGTNVSIKFNIYLQPQVINCRIISFDLYLHSSYHRHHYISFCLYVSLPGHSNRYMWSWRHKISFICGSNCCKWFLDIEFITVYLSHALLFCFLQWTPCSFFHW